MTSNATTTFSAEVFQNPYLPQDAAEVHAIMSISAQGDGIADNASALTSPLLFGMICDTSGSMGNEKIIAARRGLIHAIELLPEQASFFVISGKVRATLVVPTTQATAQAKRQAIEKVRGMGASGGTVMSSWLALALAEFEKFPDSIAQALLLTDGHNDGSDAKNLQTILQRSEGKFQCHCRGVGTDWKVTEMQTIAQNLLGTTDIIPEASAMDADFQAILKQALGKSTRSASLRLWTPKGATVLYCKQVSPELQDLTEKATQVNAQTQDYPTGAWGGNESRDYHFCIQVQPGGVGDEMLAGRASLVTTTNGVESKIAEAKVLAIWTDDESRSAKINSQVAHYTGQAELSAAIQTGLQARDRGDLETATAKLGRAVQIAATSGNESTAKLLRNLVDVEDAATGTVKLRAKVNKADAMALETRSVKTTRIQKSAS